MYNGIINIYKEKGFTSHDVVAKLRGICRQKYSDRKKSDIPAPLTRMPPVYCRCA